MNPEEPDLPDLPEVGAVGKLKAVQDTAISALRTAFPGFWAAVVLWGAAHIPVVESLRVWLIGPAQAVVLGVVAYGLRFLFGYIEKKNWVPDWFTIILLGSAKRPLYVAPVVADAVNSGVVVDLFAVKKNTTEMGMAA